MLGATAAMTLAAPAQATEEGEHETPPPSESPSPAPTESPSPSPAPEPPDNGGLPDDVDADFVTIVTCDFYVFVFRNNGEEGALEFSLTPNQDTTAGDAPDFVALLDAAPDENGFIEIPEDAGLENTAAVGADETIGPLGPLEIGEAQAHGFEAAAGLEVTVEVTVGGEPVELDNPVASFDEDAEGLGCDTGDDGEGGELPVTGNTTMFIAGGAAALLALGGGLFLIARRRRVTFTA